MSDFIPPDVIWRADRSWQDKQERIQLERGEYQGRPTYKLRMLWKTPDGQWRWSQARAATSGKTWAELGLKQKELRSLGELLIAEASKEQPALGDAPDAPGSSGVSRRLPPREQRMLAHYDSKPSGRPEHSDEIPF